MGGIDVRVNEALRVSWTLFLQGAEINAEDSEGRTPLLLAASKKSWNCVNTLIKREASKTIRDKHNRNILHLIVKNGAKPSMFDFCFCGKVRTVQIRHPMFAVYRTLSETPT